MKPVALPTHARGAGTDALLSHSYKTLTALELVLLSIFDSVVASLLLAASGSANAEANAESLSVSLISLLSLFSLSSLYIR